jgi:RNA recognition motif-containing protein
MAAPPALAVPGKLPAGQKPEKRLVATISFMAPSVDDDFMRELLDTFGKVTSWKRPKDPSTNQPKTFGFVEYEHPDSMKSALAVRC